MSVQAAARIAFATLLVALGVWIVHGFLPALAWAAVFAVVLWPAYRRLAALLPGCGLLAPLGATVLVSLGFVAPLGYAAVEVVRELGTMARYLAEVRHSGLPPPDWLGQLPGIGSAIAGWWRDNLADPQAAEALLGRLYAWLPTGSAPHFGAEIIHRLTLFAVTFLTLFFLFRDGAGLVRQLRGLSHRLLGPGGEQISRQMVAAAHGTVNGLVLVGLAEGVLLGFAYRLAGLPHPVTMAAVTGCWRSSRSARRWPSAGRRSICWRSARRSRRPASSASAWR